MRRDNDPRWPPKLTTHNAFPKVTHHKPCDNLKKRQDNCKNIFYEVQSHLKCKTKHLAKIMGIQTSTLEEQMRRGYITADVCIKLYDVCEQIGLPYTIQDIYLMQWPGTKRHTRKLPQIIY